jgi:hypothetical protein
MVRVALPAVRGVARFDGRGSRFASEERDGAGVENGTGSKRKGVTRSIELMTRASRGRAT